MTSDSPGSSRSASPAVPSTMPIPSMPGFERSVRGPFGPDDDRRRVADPGIADQAGLLVGDQVKTGAEVAFGKILLARDVQPGQQLARLEHGRSTAARPAP